MKKHNIPLLAVSIIMVLAITLVSGCTSAAPTPTATPTATPISMATPALEPIIISGSVNTATVPTGDKEGAGNATATNMAWTSPTHNSEAIPANTTTPWGISTIPVNAAAAGQLPVVLGSASTFAVLAGSTITNTGATTVKGNLGLSPGSAVTGFPPGSLIGTKHVSDPAAAQAKLDLTVAYNNAAARTLAPIVVAGNIGGRTLPPGLYKSTSSLAISSGDLTLDAKGDANAVFIFQIATTLTTTSGRQVVLSGGAQAKNVFWQVGTSATLGTTSIFKGTIMADQSITMTTGARLDGRALARIGAVTLDSNTITEP